MKSIILFGLAMFFSTLQALFFKEVGLAPFPLLAFIILFFIPNKLVINSEDIKFVFSFFIIFLISVIIGLINRDYLQGYKFYFPRVLGFVIFPFSIIFFRKTLMKFESSQVERVLNIILIIHLAFFFIQYLLFVFLNYKIDYLYSITGEVQRTGAARLKEFSNSIRASGLFTEPGSYSVYIFMLISMKFILRKKIDFIILAGIISMLLSYSMTGVLMASSLIAYYLFLSTYNFKKIKNALFLFFGLGIIFYFKSEIFLGPILDRLSNLNEDTSAEARFEGGYDFFVQNGFFYSGLGIGSLSANVTGTSVILGGLFDFGIILLILFILMQLKYLYEWSGSLKYLFLLFPVLLSNISFNQIIYTVFFAFLSLKIRDIKNQNT